MKRRRFSVLAVVLGVTLAGSSAAQTPAPRARKIEVERKRAGVLFARIASDKRLDLVTIRESDVEVRLQTGSGELAAPITLALGKELGGALIEVADLDGDGAQEIVALHRTGVTRYAYDAKAKRIARVDPALLDGQRGIPFLHLAREDFLYDMDGDGDEDLAFPVNGRVYIYAQEPGPKFVRRGEVEAERAVVQLRAGAPELGEVTRARILLPRPRLEKRKVRNSVEVNLGGGRTLRTTDGNTVVMGDYSVGTTAADPLQAFKRRHGIALKNNEAIQATLRDVDRDGFDDYTIVHRNRIWVYKGAASGFDFERTPDQLLKVAASDRVAALLLPLDEDDKVDLVLFKYRIPSTARLVAALAIGLRSEIEVLGYVNDGAPVFAKKPAYTSTFVIRVPPLLQLLGEVEELIERFRDILRPLQGVTSGDFDGDGRADVLRLASQQLEIYPTPQGQPTPIDFATAADRDLIMRFEGYKTVRRVLFEKKRQELGIESGMSLASDVVSELQGAIVRGRQPTVRIPVPPEAARRVDQIVAQDLDGDGRDDVILYVEPDPESDSAPRSARAQTQTLFVWLSGSGDLPLAKTR